MHPHSCPPSILHGVAPGQRPRPWCGRCCAVLCGAQGIITALREKAAALAAAKVQIFVRRGGPNYVKGLALMRDVGKELGLPIQARAVQAVQGLRYRHSMRCCGPHSTVWAGRREMRRPHIHACMRAWRARHCTSQGKGGARTTTGHAQAQPWRCGTNAQRLSAACQPTVADPRFGRCAAGLRA